MKRTLAQTFDSESYRWSPRLFLAFLLLGATSISGDDYLWDTQFAPDGGLVEGGSVKSLLHDWSGLVYAIGSFSAIGGVKARQVAAWDGEQWLPLGNGVRGRIIGAELDSQRNLLCQRGRRRLDNNSSLRRCALISCTKQPISNVTSSQRTDDTTHVASSTCPIDDIASDERMEGFSPAKRPGVHLQPNTP